MHHLEKRRLIRTIYAHLICIVSVFALHTKAGSQTLDWAKQLGNAEWDEGIGIATDGQGNVYSLGNFYDTLDLDPGPGIFNFISKGMMDVFVSKCDSSGNFVWAKQIGGTGWEESRAIAVDEKGNVYIAGGFLGTTDFDPGAAVFDLTSTGDRDAFICKLDTSGNFVWAKRMGGGLAVDANSIAFDSSGNVYTTGYFDGTADFDPGAGSFNLTVVGYSDIFISKLDASGNFVWVKQMGGPVGEVGHAIAVDAGGNIYTAGVFVGTVDFDPGSGTFNLVTSGPGDGDIFVTKLDAAGNFAWAKQLGGETGYAIALDNAGNVYVSGYYSWDDIFINKLDSSGNSIWAKQIGADIGYSLAVDDDHNVYITGQFHGTRDFDPGAGVFNLTAIGSSDACISKLDSAGNLIWAKQLGGTNDVGGRSLALDGNGNVYTIGSFNGTADFDPSTTNFDLTSAGSYDIFIHKMKPDPLGIDETSPIDMFKIYPNPTVGKFTVEFEHQHRGSVLVLRNIMGQVVDKRTVDNNVRTELEINDANGVYFLEVYDQNGQKAVARIIKK